MYLFRNIFKSGLLIAGLTAGALTLAPMLGVESGTALAQSTQAALNPQATAIANELKRGGKALSEIREYYAANGYRPIWLKSRNKGASLAKLVATAQSHGLPGRAFGAAQIVEQLRAASSEQDRAKAEVAASRLFVRYARALGSGYLRPKQVDSEIHVFPAVRSVKTLLDAARKASSVARLEKSLMPRGKEYTSLRKEWQRLERIVARGDWGQRIPRGKTLRPGQSNKRVAVMRQRLGRIEGRSLGDSAAYDDKLIAAVQRFQERHGLNADGVAGPATLAAINSNASDRLQQVVVAMERLRWMNRDLGKRHIRVNLADYTMRLKDGSRTVLSSRVVIGKAKEHRTPEFSKDMTHMVINPTWHVPSSIASKELLPKLKRDRNYLNKRNMRLFSSNGSVVNPANLNLSAYSENNFPYRIKQLPDRGNALGRVKFMFPNRFAIYLHDTPAKKLFGRDTRAFSHGCVRVAKPFELAYALLRPQLGSKAEGTFQSILRSEKERFVNLETPVPVHLTYESAFVGDKGKVQYRGDIYGRDRKIFRALVKAGVAVSGT